MRKLRKRRRGVRGNQSTFSGLERGHVLKNLVSHLTSVVTEFGCMSVVTSMHGKERYRFVPHPDRKVEHEGTEETEKAYGPY
jgi:hypothetical protein